VLAQAHSNRCNLAHLATSLGQVDWLTLPCQQLAGSGLTNVDKNCCRLTALPLADLQLPAPAAADGSQQMAMPLYTLI
jgi:hypothetical protein